MKTISYLIVFIVGCYSFIFAKDEPYGWKEKRRALVIADNPEVIKYIPKFPKKTEASKKVFLDAVLEGRMNIVKTMIKHGFDINFKQFANDYTPLHIAIQQKHVDIAKLLIKNGANIHAKAGKTLDRVPRKKTPLHAAASKGLIEMVKILVEKGANVNAKTYLRETPLHYAIIHGHKEIIHYLLKHGAKTHYRSRWDGKALLHKVVRGRACVYLLAYGADPFQKDKSGATAISYATEETRPVFDKALTPEIQKLIKGKRHDEVITILKQVAKETKERLDKINNEELRIARQKRKMENLEKRLKYLKKNAQKYGFSAIQQVLLSKKLNDYKWMIAFGYDLHEKNAQGQTPLEYVNETHTYKKKKVLAILEKAMTPEVQGLIKAGEKNKVIEVLTEAENSVK